MSGNRNTKRGLLGRMVDLGAGGNGGSVAAKSSPIAVQHRTKKKHRARVQLSEASSLDLDCEKPVHITVANK